MGSFRFTASFDMDEISAIVEDIKVHGRKNINLNTADVPIGHEALKAALFIAFAEGEVSMSRRYRGNFPETHAMVVKPEPPPLRELTNAGPKTFKRMVAPEPQNKREWWASVFAPLGESILGKWR